MRLNITGLNKDAQSLGPGKDGTFAHAGSRGGTELMAERILNSIDPAYREQFNIIHSRVRDLDPVKKNILVLHDTWDDPEAAHLSDPASRARFDGIVFVSNFQQATYNIGRGVPYEDGTVLQNAIVPINFTPEDKMSDTLRLIYHTTPHRGLELLVPAFEFLAERYENIHLDVFSSFDIYGWAHRDEPYKPLFDRIRAHPKMTYHGFQPNDVIRDALKTSHIYAYPCIWPETSCISAMEAMSAGLQIVTSNLAALPETTAGFANMYGFIENHNIHANRFANVLSHAIDTHNNEVTQNKLEFQKIYADNFYNLEGRAHQWNAYLHSRLGE